mmetsp:Transcript_7572/g.19726  ORF Transcript_7572/g.19726 Transcript_7572/m.19726 type:complete len:232 (+) Transcript_7572:53-748(+)
MGARGLVLALCVSAAGALTSSGHRSLPRSSRTVSRSTVTMENFGLSFAEDQTANTPVEILGERRLKTEFIKSYKPTATVLEGKPYPLLQEVQQKKLLSKTSESGLLGAVEDLGLSLSDIEKLLPAIEKSGLLGVAAKNLPLAVILTGYLLVEPAPFLIPILGAALKVPPPIFAAAALGSAAAEGLIVAANLDDYAALGFIFVPVALVSAVFAGLPVAIDAVSRLPPPAAKV